MSDLPRNHWSLSEDTGSLRDTDGFQYEHEVWSAPIQKDLSEIKDYFLLASAEIQAEWDRFAEELKEWNKRCQEIWGARSCPK